MDIVKGTENNPDCSDEDPAPEPEPLHPKTTLSDARSALGVLLRFIEDQGEEDDIKNLSRLEKGIIKISKKQATMKDFFSKQ